MILHYVASTLILKKKIYPDGRYFLMLLLTIAVGTVFSMLCESVLYRYLLAAVVTGLLAWIWRRDIRAFFAIMRKK
jgi:hypothetical protein